MMNYERNIRAWRVGDLVIHDADEKTARMLMLVTGYTKRGLVRTVYVDYTVWGNAIYKNDIGLLHDPERFGIPIPPRNAR